MESTPEQEKISSYESLGHVPYEQLGNEQEKGWDSWGNVVVHNPDGTTERASFYNSEKVTERLFTNPIIKHLESSQKECPKTIVDFGGAEGMMLEQIVLQLKDALPGLELRPILIDAEKSKLDTATKKHPETNPTEGCIFHLPLSDDSVDIGVSRMMIQYLPPASEVAEHETQMTALKEMYRVLKPGSMLELVWPAVYDFDSNPSGANAIDLIWSTQSWHRTDNFEKPTGDIEFPSGTWEIDELGRPKFTDPDRARSFTPGTIMKYFAEQCGFKVQEGGEIDWIEFRFTAKAIFERFGLKDEEKQELIDHLFESLRDRWGIDVSDWKGKKAVRLPISRLVLTK
jgi:ubiquinone/menaquinone biosynthesis C-methylase UbiE